MNIVILTGAGISAESGLETFRDQGGLWSQYDVEDVATPQAYARNPALVHEVSNLLRRINRTANPNAAHFALADLESRHDGNFLLVTQNIDTLHQRAGSRNVLHMHGSIEVALCSDCGHTWPAPDEMSEDDCCMVCRKNQCRPDLVWFGENVRFLDEIEAATEAADLFAFIGSSGEVYPAAGLMELAQESGAKTVEINLHPSAVASAADEVILGPAGHVVPKWVEKTIHSAVL